MSLGMIPIFWLEFLGDFWRKSQNEQGGKAGQKSGLHLSEEHLRRDEVLCNDEAE